MSRRPKVMCEFHLRGECRYGVHCWNVHASDTFRHPSTAAHYENLAREDHRTSNTNSNALTAQTGTQDPYARPAQSTSTRGILAQMQIEDFRAMMAQRYSTSNTNALIAQAQAQDRYARPSQSTITSNTSTRGIVWKMPIQDFRAMMAQSTSTITTSTDVLIPNVRVQNHYARPAQSTSTSTTSTYVLTPDVRVQGHYASPAQSTSTSTTSTYALIPDVQVQGHYARPTQSTSTSTTSTHVVIPNLRVQGHYTRPAQSTRNSTTSTYASIPDARVQGHYARPTQSTSTRITSIDALIPPIVQQPVSSTIAVEQVANKLSVVMKTGKGNSVKETASNFQAHHQKKKNESTENDGSLWDDILMFAIDSDLQCNICFEIFIKPTVLNCSHTFCEMCILIWTNRVLACPICREEVKSKSYCLTLESFIEKIVEHLPKEIKDKREVAIKDRGNINIERQRQETHRSDPSEFVYVQQRGNSAIILPRYGREMNRNVDFNTDVLVNESEMFRMNLHDIVVSTRGVNPLMSYIAGPEDQTSNRWITRPFNSSARH